MARSKQQRELDEAPKFGQLVHRNARDIYELGDPYVQVARAESGAARIVTEREGYGQDAHVVVDLDPYQVDWLIADLQGKSRPNQLRPEQVTDRDRKEGRRLMERLAECIRDFVDTLHENVHQIWLNSADLNRIALYADRETPVKGECQIWGVEARAYDLHEGYVNLFSADRKVRAYQL